MFDKNHPFSLKMRELARLPNRTYETYSSYIEQAPPDIAANTMLCLIHQTNYLLDRQLQTLEQQFLEGGGFTERLYHARKAHRKGDYGR